MLRPLINQPDLSNTLRNNEDDERRIELEYQYHFEGDQEDNPIYKVQILNNLNVE